MFSKVSGRLLSLKQMLPVWQTAMSYAKSSMEGQDRYRSRVMEA